MLLNQLLNIPSLVLREIASSSWAIGHQEYGCQSLVNPQAFVGNIVIWECRPHQQELRAWAENLVLGRPQAEELDKKVCFHKMEKYLGSSTAASCCDMFVHSADVTSQGSCEKVQVDAKDVFLKAIPPLHPSFGSIASCLG